LCLLTRYARHRLQFEAKSDLATQRCAIGDKNLIHINRIETRKVRNQTFHGSSRDCCSRRRSFRRLRRSRARAGKGRTLNITARNRIVVTPLGGPQAPPTVRRKKGSSASNVASMLDTSACLRPIFALRRMRPSFPSRRWPYRTRLPQHARQRLIAPAERVHQRGANVKNDERGKQASQYDM
jgi:hypothetical protein